MASSVSTHERLLRAAAEGIVAGLCRTKRAHREGLVFTATFGHHESDTAWQSWAADLERAFVALVSICHLFHGRDAEPKLGALRGLVERLTQQPFDGTTLKVLCCVHGQTVKVEGGGSGDDESKAIVRLGCFPDPNGEWNTQQSNKRARTGPSGARDFFERGSCELPAAQLQRQTSKGRTAGFIGCRDR